MKIKTFKSLFLILFAAAALCACKKDDKIEIAHLQGTWTAKNSTSNIAEADLVRYTFNADQTCSIYIHYAASNTDTTLYRTYVLSMDKKLVTLFNDAKRYTEQYNINKLTATEMHWTNASPGDGNADKQLSK